MKICVWRTEHEIADTVAGAAFEGLENQFNNTIGASTQNYKDAFLTDAIEQSGIHIGYGILRGMADVFRGCDKLGKPWFNIDKGYWKPSHYAGYYRVSLRGTQQTWNWPAPDWERWRDLGLVVEPPCEQTGRGILSCPPTDYVEEFFNVKDWFYNRYPFFHARNCNIRKRAKGSTIPLNDDFNSNDKVETFNSSVGWEALRRGIPVESDPRYSIVGSWAKTHDLMATREGLFATMAGLQLTLSEMREGKLWPLMQKLLDINRAR